MRTTVTLDPDTEQLIRRRMRERKVSFKQALNDAVREGARRESGAEPSYRVEVADLGRPRVDLDKALQLAAELEDEELARRMRGGA